MAIITYPLNGIDYDAENAETYLCTRTSGVYSADGNFQASVTGDRQVTISTGIAWIRNTEAAGKSVYVSEPVAVNIPVADGTRDRIDRIVLRFDKAANRSEIVVKQGEPSGSAVAPSVERTELVCELGLCTVLCRAASTLVNIADVTSTLLDESVCGIMRDGVTGIPTAQLQEQAEALIDDLQNEITGVKTGAEVMVKSVYDPTGRNEDIFALLDKTEPKTVFLPATGWSDGAPYTQQVSVDDVTDKFQAGYPVIETSTTNPEEIEQLRENLSLISYISSGNGFLEFACLDDKPSIDMTVKVPAVSVVSDPNKYTKTEANNKFAKAFVTTSSAAASLDIYPDAESAIVPTLYGFTSQAGTGDPSPENVREITVGGLKLGSVTVNGPGIDYDISYVVVVGKTARVTIGVSNLESYKTKKYAFSSYLPYITSYVLDEPHFYNGNNALYVFVPSTEVTSKESAEVYFEKHPITFWYPLADESQATGLYLPVSLQGAGYQGYCQEITAPMCAGDSLALSTKSGCDQTITLDGSAVTVTASGSNYVATAENAVADGTVYAEGLAYLTLAAGQIVIPASSFPSSVTSAETANTWLQSNPQKVWYKSTAYTEENDIQVALENHNAHMQLLTGEYPFEDRSDLAANLFILSTVRSKIPNPTEAMCVCDYYKCASTSWTGLPDLSIQTITSHIGFRDTRYSSIEEALQGLNENPITLVYALATPITYAHDPVTFTADPDSTGLVTVTGQSGGTVSAKYNKSLVKAFEEVATSLAALESAQTGV